MVSRPREQILLKNRMPCNDTPFIDLAWFITGGEPLVRKTCCLF
jgi:hypothetical protein